MENGNDYPDSVFYTAQCSCGSDDHIHSICLDYDRELSGMISMLLYSKFDFHIWRDTDYEDGVINYVKEKAKSLYNRIKYSAKVLFLGQFDWDEAFMFVGEKQISDYITALQYGLKKVKAAEAKTKKAKPVKKGKKTK